VEAIVSFLEVNSLQDIIVVPTNKLGLIHLKENSILCSGYTPKHIYKAAKDLVVELKKLKIPNLPFVPTVFGRRDQEWNIVEIGEIQIHFFVDTYRKEVDLIGRWLNPMSEEDLEWQRRIDAKYYGKKKL
jgi:ribosomal silencing factor RsfS